MNTSIPVTILPSNQEYVDNGGNNCPACNSENIEAGNLEADGSQAWCNVVCKDCKREWTDYYKLSGYDMLAPEFTN